MNKSHTNTWKRCLTGVCLFVFVLLLGTCYNLSKDYPFENKNELIESIELIYHPYSEKLEGEDELISIRFLGSDEIPAFMKQVYTLETDRALPTPPTGWGVYIARVTYENGDVEYLGSLHIEFVESGKTPVSLGTYYFTGDSFEQLFLEYAGDFKHLGHEDDTPVFSKPKS